MRIKEKDYELAWLIREFEKKLLDLFSLGKLHGTVHTCIGQEFSAISVLKNFVKGDWATSNHRGHGHFLSITKDFEGIMAEVMGRKSGVCKGIGGSQHLYAEGFLSNGIQGGMSPIAVGMAKSLKLDKSDNIVFSFIGDGTLGEGSLYESLNISSKWDIPVLWIIDNNGYAQSTNTKTTIAGNVKDRSKAFGIKYFYCEIWDIENCFSIAEKAANYVRTMGKPAFLEIKSYRLMAHSKGDDNRKAEEIELFSKKDPLNIYLSKNPSFKAKFKKIRSIIDDAEKKGLRSEYCSYTPQSKDLILKEKLGRPFIKNNKRVSDQIYFGLQKSFNKNKKLMMIGEDIEGPYGGAFRITRSLSQEFVGRLINTPIAESAIIGISTGLSLMGRQCIAEIMFGDFITLTFDQILQHACKFQDMYAGAVNVPLIVRTPMGGRRGYGPTHSQSLEKHFLGIYGLSVVALNHRINIEDFYTSLIPLVKSPHLIIENKVSYTNANEKEIPGMFSLKCSENIYPSILISPPEDADLTILCYGGMLEIVERVLEPLLFEHEIMVEIICPSLLSSIDIEEIQISVKKSKKILAIEEGDPYTGYSAQIIAEIHESGVNNFIAKIMGYSGIIPTCLPRENELLVSEDDIINKAKEIINEEL